MTIVYFIVSWSAHDMTQRSLGNRSFVHSFVLFAATVEAVTDMLMHSTALRPVTARPSVHLQCVREVSVGDARLLL